MARKENPPFGRGETYFGVQGQTPDAVSGAQLEGTIWEFEDINYGATAPGAKPQRSGHPVLCMIVRNVSGIPLLPKRLATLRKENAGNALGAPKYTGQVDGYVTVDGDRCYPVDEFLPAAGVQNLDLFFIVIEGPAMCLTDLAAAGTNVILVGDPLLGLTAATSQATTAGHLQVATAPLAASTGAALAMMGNNIIGRALSAATTANTNTGLLVDMARRW